MTQKNFSPLRFFVVVFLLVLGLVIFSNKEEAKRVVKIILESNWPTVLLWLFSIVGVVSERFFSTLNVNNESGVIYQSFGKYADAIFSIATFGFAGSTSLALLKGLYLQLFFDGTYFTGFADFDLASIFLISSFLLFHSANGALRLIINAVFQAEAKDITPAKT
ncbi:hypothetical protein [Duganella fentianensis]|uniref:hypothetical protein n=1 Tax=Duganella fentianensis TaxID=2692177 RepID=UPI0032B28672